MIPYIAHRRFKGKALCNGDAPEGRINIPATTTLELHGQDLLCLPDGRAIAYRHSQNGVEHFARNDDGRGLLRGQLTYAIAYGPREADREGRRFTVDEQRMLVSEYRHWLEPLDHIVFNNAFYDAEIEDLQELAERLNIHV